MSLIDGIQQLEDLHYEHSKFYDWIVNEFEEEPTDPAVSNSHSVFAFDWAIQKIKNQQARLTAAEQTIAELREVVEKSGLKCTFAHLSTCTAEAKMGRLTKNKYCGGCMRRDALQQIDKAKGIKEGG